ncbi:Carbohydrate-binding family 9 [Sphingobacterium wenxiniae]|uniref:Carbohydrate-binding family 9 n=2 Tax=Sphingobacterium wenxiniae TaxID=683125 RepID=A0A1I6NWG5_9SPHI|nr:Carbohydrate-binding family 9 [Sphingobacterium wenxiniae]
MRGRMTKQSAFLPSSDCFVPRNDDNGGLFGQLHVITLNMKQLTVPKININTEHFDYYTLGQQLKNLPSHSISEVNWPADYPYCPSVKFQAAHNDTAIFLHYTVEEEFVKAQFVRPNESVWEDSCVEFFLSFDKQHYYNFEFNVLGTGLIGYGTEVKAERTRLSAEEILKVKTTTSVVNVESKKSWSIILVIPTELLGKEQLSGTKAYANFYKCGDGLPTPHFISWNRIEHPTPNFHLPTFFGEIQFQ